MISTETKKQACKGVFDLITSMTVESLIQNTPVMLRDDGRVFTGSGVILAKDSTKRKMWVATAKHNIWFYCSKKVGYAGDPATWSEDDAQTKGNLLKTKFKNEVRVHYQAVDVTHTDPNSDMPTSFASANIDKILFSEAGFQYDACLLEVSYEPEATPRIAFFDYFSREPALRPAVKKIRDIQTTGELPARTHLIQAGFGKQGQKNTSGELKDGQLLFKVSEFKTDGTPGTYYDEHVDAYNNVFLLNSTDKWTTLSGDSGGPLFAVSPDSCFVLGVTLGSDSFAREDDEPETLQADPDGKYNNTATSLLAVYEALLSG